MAAYYKDDGRTPERKSKIIPNKTIIEHLYNSYRIIILHNIAIIIPLLVMKNVILFYINFREDTSISCQLH